MAARPPAPWHTLPRVRLRDGSAPLVHLERFSAAVGTPVWAKRDDVGSIAFAGNKVRKLELLLADAIAQDCDVVVAVGAAQSNFARTAAASAARLGLRAILILGGRDPGRLTGNLLLDRLVGAHIRFAGSDAWDVLQAALDDTCQELRREGRRPYALPMGGSTPLGAVAFAAAYEELVLDLDAARLAPGAVVHASASGGTQAGLELGRRVLGRGPRVHAVDVSKTGGDLRPVVAGIASSAARLLGIDETWTAADVEADGSQLGGGYGVPTASGLEAISLLARTEGIVCDPVYTGKALAAVVAMARAGTSGPVVFWHTGGAPAIFDPHYGDQLSGALVI